MSHVDQILALMRATGYRVEDGYVPDKPTFPYAVLWARTPDRSINRLDHDSTRLDLRFLVTSVGITGDSVRIVAAAMQEALLDVRIATPGWANYPIRDTGNDQPMRQDTAVTLTNDRHPLYVVDEYHLAAERVTA